MLSLKTDLPEDRIQVRSPGWDAGLHKIFFVRKRQLFEQKLSMKVRKLLADSQQNTINQWVFANQGMKPKIHHLSPYILKMLSCVSHKQMLSVSNTFLYIFRAEPRQNIHDFGQNLSMRFEFVR